MAFEKFLSYFALRYKCPSVLLYWKRWKKTEIMNLFLNFFWRFFLLCFWTSHAINNWKLPSTSSVDFFFSQFEDWIFHTISGSNQDKCCIWNYSSNSGYWVNFVPSLNKFEKKNEKYSILFGCKCWARVECARCPTSTYILILYYKYDN